MEKLNQNPSNQDAASEVAAYTEADASQATGAFVASPVAAYAVTEDFSELQFPDDWTEPYYEYKLPRPGTALLLIDVQERLLPAMTGGSEVAQQCEILLRAAAILDLPVLVTEQYPKGLGPTIAPLESLLAEITYEKFEKITYTALTPEVQAALEAKAITHVLVCGMETHVCVWQTVRDLCAAGYAVQLLADAVCSRKTFARDTAIEAMRAMGAVVSVSETALFDLLGQAGTPEFKAISKLIK